MGNEFSQHHHENVDISTSPSQHISAAPLVSLIHNNNSFESSINENVENVCYICSDPIEIYSVSQCDHRTCHLCTLRTRILLESDKCAYCRTQQNEVLLTRDSKKSFKELKSSPINWLRISKINILCEDVSIFHETTRMMELQCPSKDCKIVCDDWHKLMYHVRIAHNKMFCNMCIVNRKIFSSEHQLYTRDELISHYNGDNTTDSSKDSYFQGHPSCVECNIHLYDSVELYDHYLIHHQFVPNTNLLRSSSSHHGHNNHNNHINHNNHNNHSNHSNYNNHNNINHINRISTSSQEHFDRHLIEASDIDLSLLLACGLSIIAGLISVIGNITVPGCHDFERFCHSVENLFVSLMNHDEVGNEQNFEIIKNVASSLYMVGGRCLMLFMYLMIIFWVLKGWFFIMSWVIYGGCFMIFGKVCWDNLTKSLITRE